MTRASFRSRDLRICYYNAETRVVDAGLARFENLLHQLGSVEIVSVQGLDDTRLHPSDLLIVAAAHLPDDNFLAWLQALTKRMARQNHIWVPCLVLADISFTELAKEILPYAIEENWYFDVMSPDHLESMPMRVANLLRIHDHLHELQRYEKALDQLSSEADALQTRLDAMAKETDS